MSVVRSQQFDLNDTIFKTTRPRALKFGKERCLVDFYQVYSNDAPSMIQNGSAAGWGWGLGLKNEIY